jgi:hypothetical protein
MNSANRNGQRRGQRRGARCAKNSGVSPNLLTHSSNNAVVHRFLVTATTKVEENQKNGLEKLTLVGM